MNEKCKYCDYISKCSRICEYNSFLCKVNRSFPKIVNKSYEQLQEENQQLQEKIEYFERSNNHREDTILEQRQEISNLEQQCKKQKEVIDKLSKIIYEIDYLRKTTSGYPSHYLDELLDILKEV